MKGEGFKQYFFCRTRGIPFIYPKLAFGRAVC